MFSVQSVVLRLKGCLYMCSNQFFAVSDICLDESFSKYCCLAAHGLLALGVVQPVLFRRTLGTCSGQLHRRPDPSVQPSLAAQFRYPDCSFIARK
jgi:hypothetical protein